MKREILHSTHKNMLGPFCWFLIFPFLSFIRNYRLKPFLLNLIISGRFLRLKVLLWTSKYYSKRFQKTCFLKRQTNALKRRAYYSSEYRAARPCCSKISSRFFGGQILPPPLYLYLFFYHTGCTVFLNVLSFQFFLTPICNQNPLPPPFAASPDNKFPTPRGSCHYFAFTSLMRWRIKANNVEGAQLC